MTIWHRQGAGGTPLILYFFIAHQLRKLLTHQATADYVVIIFTYGVPPSVRPYVRTSVTKTRKHATTLTSRQNTLCNGRHA